MTDWSVVEVCKWVHGYHLRVRWCNGTVYEWSVTGLPYPCSGLVAEGECRSMEEAQEQALKHVYEILEDEVETSEDRTSLLNWAKEKGAAEEQEVL